MSAMMLTNPLDRIQRGGGKAVWDAAGKLTITPASGQGVQIAGTVGIGTPPVQHSAIMATPTLTFASVSDSGYAVNVEPTFHTTLVGTQALVGGLRGSPIITGVEGVTNADINVVLGVVAGGTVDASFDGDIGAWYSQYIDTIYHNGGGTIAEAYGLYIAANTSATTNYGIYVDGTAKNVIIGPLGVGVDPSTTAKLYVAQGTITTDINAIRADATWNAAGVTFTAIEVQVTNTASAAGSKLLDLLVGGTSQFSVDKAGAVTIGPGGAPINKVLVGSATYDPPNLTNGSSTTTTVTVTGAAVGDLVVVSHSAITSGAWHLYGYVSAADTVTVSITNHTGGTVNLASGTLKAIVFKA